MRILFFAQLKDVTRCDSIELELPAPVAAEQIWAVLLRKFPALAAHRASVRLAKNLEYAGPETTFANEDEAALIPPVSGG
jgi:molybdopterin converting factor subunit 1